MESFNKWLRGENSFSAQEHADHTLNKPISYSLIYMEGLVDKTVINIGILRPLLI